MSKIADKDSAREPGPPLRLGDWLWRPCYAKLWWAAVPLYWLGMLLAVRSNVLASFYHSALTGYLTIFFFPPMVALILSYGFFRAWLAAMPQQSSHGDDPCGLDHEFYDHRRRGPSGMPSEIDPLDPSSGALWIGNPLNPLNPGYINRAS